MIDLNNYYNEVLTKFNFSISGYNNIEENISDFFNYFVASTSMANQNHIDFISYAYSKLINLNDWKQESTHFTSFFFNTFNERSLELLMVHEYYAFKKFINDIDFDKIEKEGKELDLTTNEVNTVKNVNTSELSAKVFRRPVPYRVLLTQSKLIEVLFDKRMGVLTLKVPYNQIFEDINGLDEIKRKVFNSFEEELLKTQQKQRNYLVSKSDNLYKKNEVDSFCFSMDLGLLDEAKIKNTIEIVTKKLVSLNNYMTNKLFRKPSEEIEKYFLKAFSKLLISHAFISFLFDCWVENIPSIIDVDEANNDQRCLGSFIIGYGKSQELSPYERTLFRITSDRISSNLASSAIESVYPDIQLSRARYRQISFLKTFKAELEKFYNLEKYNAKSKRNDKWENLHDFELGITKDWIIDYLNSKKKLLDDCGLSLMIKYFNEIAEGESCDIALLTELNQISDSTVANKNRVYQYIEDNDKKEISHNGRSLVNIVLPHYLLQQLTTNRTKENGVTAKTEGSYLYIQCKMKNKKDHLRRLITNMSNFHESGQNLSSFLIKHFNEILIIGNLEIGVGYEEDKFEPKVNMKKDLYLKDNKLQYRGDIDNLNIDLDEVVWKINFFSI